eukprot:1161576-Pelagomonas_calceolata.AAC.1
MHAGSWLAKTLLYFTLVKPPGLLKSFMPILPSVLMHLLASDALLRWLLLTLLTKIRHDAASNAPDPC